jgi:hypothetical protein
MLQKRLGDIQSEMSGIHMDTLSILSEFSYSNHACDK